MAREGAVRRLGRKLFHPHGEASPSHDLIRRNGKRRYGKRTFWRRVGRRLAGGSTATTIDRGDYPRAASWQPVLELTEVDEYGFPVIDLCEAGLEVTPGHWERSFKFPRNVVTSESGLHVKPTLVARAGRSGDACLIAAAPRMLEALRACERELDDRLRFEHQLVARCVADAEYYRNFFVVGERDYVRRMRGSAERARRRIESLEVARRKARKAIAYARPELADEMGWHWPDYGDESTVDRESPKAA